MKVMIRAFNGWVGQNSNQADALYSKLLAMKMDRRPLHTPDDDTEILIEDILDETDKKSGRRKITIIGEKRERQPSEL